MATRDKLIQEAVSQLQSIQSIDELNDSKTDFMNTMGQYFQSCVEEFGNFMDGIGGVPPDEIASKAAKYKDDNYLLDPAIGKEMQRIEKIPGAIDITDQWGQEMEKRMEPYIDEYSKHAQKLMTLLMGGYIEGVKDAFEKMSDDFGQEDESSDAFASRYEAGNPDTPDMLYMLYDSRNLEELEQNLESIKEQMLEDIQDLYYELELLVELDKDALEMEKEKIESIKHKVSRIEPELDNELNRIASGSGNAERTEEIKEEIMDSIKEKYKWVKGFLRRLN